MSVMRLSAMMEPSEHLTPKYCDSIIGFNKKDEGGEQKTKFASKIKKLHDERKNL